MFSIPRPYLRFIEEPVTDGGGSDTAADDNLDDIDFSQFGVTEAESTEPTATDAPSATAPGEKTPDMWEPVLAALPDDATRAMIKPHLAEWEKNTTQRFMQIREEYKPWETFKQQGLSPQDLQVRYQLTEQLDKDPVQFMERLKGALIQQGLYQEAQQVQEKIDDTKEEQEVDPIEALTRQQQEFFQRVEQQRLSEQQQAIARQADAQVDSELNMLREKYKMSPVLEKELIQRAVLMNQQQNRFVPLTEVWADLQNFIRASRQASPGQRAPRVLPPGGGLPAPEQKDVATLSEQERKQRAYAVVERFQNQG